jgi:hypothetical protein
MQPDQPDESSQPLQKGRLMDDIERRLDELSQEMGQHHKSAPPQLSKPSPQPQPILTQQQPYQLQPKPPQLRRHPLQLPNIPRLTESVLRGSQGSSRVGSYLSSQLQLQSAIQLRSGASPGSNVSRLDASSVVVWMLGELELIVRQFVASLRMRLGGMSRPANQVLKTAIRHCERVEHELATTQEGTSNEPDTTLSTLAFEGFAEAQAAAIEASDYFMRAHASQTQGVRSLKDAHGQVLRALDAAVISGVTNIPQIREQAECMYTVKRREIAPRVLADYMEKSSKILSELCNTSLARCAKAPHFTIVPSGRIHQQFKMALQSLSDTMSATK